RLGQRCERTVGPGEAGPTRRPPANDARASASGTTIRTASEGWGDATGGSGVRGDGSGLGHRTRDQSALRGRGSEDRGGRSAAGNGGGDGGAARRIRTLLVCGRRRERPFGRRDVRAG